MPSILRFIPCQDGDDNRLRRCPAGLGPCQGKGASIKLPVGIKLLATLLWTIVESLFGDTITQEWTGTATDLESKLGYLQSLRDISPSTACTGKYLNRLEEKKDQPHLQLLVTNKSRDYPIALKEG